MKQYYVYIPGNETVQGPFPAAMIQKGYAQGIYSPFVMVQEVNGSDWVSIGSVFSKALPPPPPVHVAIPNSNNKGTEKGCSDGLAIIASVGFLVVAFLAFFGRHFFRTHKFHDYPIFGTIVTIAIFVYLIAYFCNLFSRSKKK